MIFIMKASYQPHSNTQIHSPQYLLNFQKIQREGPQVTLSLSHYLRSFSEIPQAFGLVVIVYNEKMIHIKINQKKKHIKQSLRGFSNETCYFSSNNQ